MSVILSSSVLCRVGIAILSAGNRSLSVGAVNACVSGLHTGLGFKHVAVLPWGECEYVGGAGNECVTVQVGKSEDSFGELVLISHCVGFQGLNWVFDLDITHP